jgi:[protein-PII] uridylyltransferase
MKETLTDILCAKTLQFMTARDDGFSISQQLTDIVDETLMETAGINLGADGCGLALFAVGGYGRGDMSPFSDIDIMLLSEKRDKQVMDSAQSTLYRLWDMGLNISHCFRTLNECLEDSFKDIQTRTALLEARFIAGDKNILIKFKSDIYQKLLFKNRKGFVGEIFREIDRRHMQFGDSVYLLEPNLKEGRGCLRDIHAISWLLKSTMASGRIEGLQEMLSPADYKHFFKAWEFLLKLRACLHATAKIKTDVLSFDLQRPVAKMLGFSDTKRFQAAEILMRLYYKKARIVMDALKKVSSVCGSRYFKPVFSFSFANKVKKITEYFYLSGNEIIAKNSDVFKSTDKILEAFYVYSITGKKFSRQTKESIRKRFLFINNKTRSSAKAASLFIEILKSYRVYETLREMHSTGVLDRFIPEFGRLRHLVIYEPYHRYTVDEHTLIAVKHLEMLKKNRYLGIEYLSEIFKNVKSYVLFLALLLHDIGKGAHICAAEGHEAAGYMMLKGIMERLNIESADRKTVEFLVKNHIILSKLTLTRDPEAPETIAGIAEIVETQDNLNALYLMTYADMNAVNPSFWSRWKAYLFHDIYEATMKHLKGAGQDLLCIDDARLRDFVKEMPERYLISNTIENIRSDYDLSLKINDAGLAMSISANTDGTAELVIVTTDRSGLFMRIARALGIKGLNILRSRLYTGKNNLVVDKITVSNWKDVWWHGMESELRNELSQTLVSEGSPNIGSAVYESCSPMPVTVRLRKFTEVDNDSSADYTILELFSPDRLGLLYDISVRLNDCGIDILSAVINTDDGIAHDVFYIHKAGMKLDAEDTINALSSVAEIVFAADMK